MSAQGDGEPHVLGTEVATFCQNTQGKIETPIAAHDERACHNGFHHKMQRIEFVQSLVDLKR